MKYTRIQIGSAVEIVGPAVDGDRGFAGKAGIVIERDRKDPAVPWRVAVVGIGPLWFNAKSIVRRPAFRPSRSLRVNRAAR